MVVGGLCSGRPVRHCPYGLRVHYYGSVLLLRQHLRGRNHSGPRPLDPTEDLAGRRMAALTAQRAYRQPGRGPCVAGMGGGAGRTGATAGDRGADARPALGPHQVGHRMEPSLQGTSGPALCSSWTVALGRTYAGTGRRRKRATRARVLFPPAWCRGGPWA